MTLTEPNSDYVQKRLRDLDGDARFYGGERAVGLVFDQWPTNDNFEQVLVKTVVLNRVYNTSIYDVWTVAQHILDLGIDSRLHCGDPSLINDIATVRFSNGQTRFVFSFATKYCSWHEPRQFQIYDRYVEEMLWRYQKAFNFAAFRRYEVRNYQRFVQIIDQFKAHFGLEEIERKQLDKFLWIEGKQVLK